MTAISVNNTDLNSQLEMVAELYLELRDIDAVALELGISPVLAAKLVSKTDVILLQKLKVQLLQLGPLAVKTLQDCMGNTGAGPNALNAAKTVLDRIGLVPPKASDPDRAKGLEAMSRDELLSVIQAAERQLGDRAVPVSPVVDAQVSDILD